MSYPSTIEPNKEDNGQVAFKCVTVNGIAGDFAIYVGPTDWTDEQIRLGGLKLRSETGNQLAFDLPFLEHQWYNRTYRR